MPRWATIAKLPWGSILAGTTALLKQANDLRVSRMQPPVATPAQSDVEALSQRVGEFERQQRADAEIIQQLAAQIETIAAAAQATEARVKQAHLLAIVGIAIAVVATAVAWLR